MKRSELIDQMPGLRRYARALTGDPWAADDLVQDTLERACSKWRLWTVGTDLRAWLFTLMHNLHVSGLRQTQRRSGSGTQVDPEDVAAELVAPDSAQDLVLDLQRCLLRLPEEQRAVLLLVSLEDMSYDQVARITGTPVGTVMSRLSRARTRLQTLMNATATNAPPPDACVPTHLRRLK
ncbi:sigma-70 family RNA polymerase sigma factor [Hydrogenophaga sp. 2FB]|uniref:sigma-70 family RNA polymerase sigma factor n=1 Tax=Hydrogenophaga sp. 2FB TaxID=2502187 RepID=UPI0010F87B0B|nr:sigma-70 family RNA polymerase sigma factor [Hydrogenophaga sp. 2FB]